MPDTSAILSSCAFWRFYVHASDDPLDAEILRHFDTTTTGGEKYAQGTISLPCGLRSSLEVSITPQLGMIDLGLRNRNTNRIAQMGWWDEGRWHPHALRWCELVRLQQYWLRRPLRQVHPRAAFLLLAPFVGNGAGERDQFSERKSDIARQYEQLQLFTRAEIADLAERTFIVPSEKDYDWSYDGELGWVFGGDYPCYSIRNRSHLSGTEGRFPFSDWSRAMAELAPRAEES